MLHAIWKLKTDVWIGVVQIINAKAVGNSRKRYGAWEEGGGRTFANRKAMSAESKAKLSALMKARWAPGGKFHGKSKTAGLAPPGDLNLQAFDW